MNYISSWYNGENQCHYVFNYDPNIRPETTTCVCAFSFWIGAEADPEILSVTDAEFNANWYGTPLQKEIADAWAFGDSTPIEDDWEV